MKSFETQIYLTQFKQWQSIHRTSFRNDGDPYRYPSMENAQKSLDICYPDHKDSELRIVEVNQLPNIII